MISYALVFMLFTLPVFSSVGTAHVFQQGFTGSGVKLLEAEVEKKKWGAPGIHKGRCQGVIPES